MSNKKNEYKEEKIVMSKQPFNYGHPSPEIKRQINARMEVLINDKSKEDFTEFCKPYGGVSKVLREYAEFCLKNKKLK